MQQHPYSLNIEYEPLKQLLSVRMRDQRMLLHHYFYLRLDGFFHLRQKYFLQGFFYKARVLGAEYLKRGNATLEKAAYRPTLTQQRLHRHHHSKIDTALPYQTLSPF